MSDITLTHSVELMVAQAEGHTEQGVELVDAWVSPGIFVAATGNIIIRAADAAKLERAAVAQGLTVDHDLVGAER